MVGVTEFLRVTRGMLSLCLTWRTPYGNRRSPSGESLVIKMVSFGSDTPERDDPINSHKKNPPPRHVRAHTYTSTRDNGNGP